MRLVDDAIGALADLFDLLELFHGFNDAGCRVASRAHRRTHWNNDKRLAESVDAASAGGGGGVTPLSLLSLSRAGFPLARDVFEFSRLVPPRPMNDHQSSIQDAKRFDYHLVILDCSD